MAAGRLGKTMKSFGRLVAATLLLSFIPACASPSSHNASANASVILANGAINVAVTSIPGNLNPLTPEGSGFVSREIVSQVLPSVFQVNPQEFPVLNSSIMESAELVSTSPQTVEYKLNPRARWSDGKPMGLADFVYDWHAQSGDPQFKDLGGQPFQAVPDFGYEDIASISGSQDGRVVTVKFKQAFSDWESMFSPLIPAGLSERIGWSQGFNASSLTGFSGGPFEIVSSGPADVILGRNPHFWGPRTSLASVTFKLVSSSAKAAEAVLNGSAQLATSDGSELLPPVTPGRLLEGSQTLLGESFEQIDFNLRDPLFSDYRVRDAIANYVNRGAIANLAIGSYEQGAPLNNNHIFVNGQSNYVSDGNEYNSPHPGVSEKEMTEANFTMGGDGYWHAPGSSAPLTVGLSFDSSKPLSDAVANELVGELKAAGIAVSLLPRNGTGLAKELDAGNFQMAEVQETVSPYPSWSAFEFGSFSAQDPFGSGKSLRGGSGGQEENVSEASANPFGYDNTQVNSLFQAAIVNPDPYHAGQDYDEIDNLLWGDMVALPLFQDPTEAIWSASLVGVSGNPSLSTPFWNMQSWRVTEAPGIPLSSQKVK